jgi:hypothetical protein
LVALVKEIPKMGLEQYRQQIKEMGLTEDMSHGHSHEESEHEHE